MKDVVWFLILCYRCHLPLLYVGLEYGLTNNSKLAERFFNQALTIAPDDPFVLHEIGVIAYQSFESVLLLCFPTVYCSVLNQLAFYVLAWGGGVHEHRHLFINWSTAVWVHGIVIVWLVNSLNECMSKLVIVCYFATCLCFDSWYLGIKKHVLSKFLM